MLFSILIANYNNGHFFNDCFQSIINQTYQNFEVIVVDDGSTDDSVNIIKQLIISDKRFKLLTKTEINQNRKILLDNFNKEKLLFELDEQLNMVLKG